MENLQMHKTEYIKREKKSLKMERCVLCGRKLDISVDIPITERKTYVETAGQLCEECCWEIYGTNYLQSNE